MNRFEVKYSLSGKIVLVLIVIPLLWTIPLFVAVALMPDMPEWMIPLLVVIILLGAIITTLRLVNNKLTVPCEVTMNDERLEIKLLRHSFLYTITHYESEWANIENVSSNIDTQNNKRFYQVRFRKPAKTISLSTDDIIETADEETEFGKILLSYVNKFNNSSSAAALKIHSKGFYDSWWAKLLTFFAWVMTALVIVVSFTRPDSINIWKILGFFAYCVIWLTAYYTNRKKQ